MEDNINLGNAAVVGENSESAFIIIEGNRLHAVDERVASLKKEEGKTEDLLPLIQKALQSLINFADGKIPSHFIAMGQKTLSERRDDSKELVAKIEQIYTHLPHHERNTLSSLIHHSQKAS